MRSYTTAVVLQYVELHSLVVAVEYANEGVSLCAWDETESALVHYDIHKNRSRPKLTQCI